MQFKHNWISLVNETRNESTGIVFGFHLRSIMWSRVSTGRVYLLIVLCIDKTFHRESDCCGGDGRCDSNIMSSVCSSLEIYRLCGRLTLLRRCHSILDKWLL